MKRLFVLSVILALMLGVAYGEDEREPQQEPKIQSICPKTLMDNSCLTCHSYPSFILKEISPESRHTYPISDMHIKDNYAYYILGSIDAGDVQKLFDYILWHPSVKKIIIEVHSPGGSLFDGYKIVGLMQHMMARGYVIETRVYGFAASAGFLVAASGTVGHRLVSKTAELMWHELMSFSMFQVSTPSSTEEQSRVLRHLQTTANNWLAKRSKLTLGEIDDLIKRKEFWMSGSDAVEYGFADGFLE